MQEVPQNAALVSAAAGVSLHRQLFLVLNDEIGRGALAAGAALPSEQSLCDQFGVSRITVRRALADLADAGLIERRHGIGSFVCEQPPPRRDGGSYLDEVRQVEFETEVDVLEFGIGALPHTVAERLLGLRQGLHVLRLRRERRTREPLMITEAWLPAEVASTVTESALAAQSLHQLLIEAGAGVDRLEHALTAELAGPRSATLLDVAIGAPLMRVTTVAFAGTVPHHVLSLVLSPNRSRFVLNQTVSDADAGVGLAIAHDVRRPTS